MLGPCLKFGFVVLLALGLSCALPRAQDQRDYSASANPHIRLYANILKESVWTSTRILVCWENAEGFAAETAMVRSAINETWATSSALQFVGWQRCAAENAGIRIRIDDSGPHTKGLGRALDRKPAGMVLNFQFQNWSQTCQENRDYCIRTIAVHEFGHAIGFAHEQNRDDAPCDCRPLRQGADGDVMLTPYDESSVMNYCNPKYGNNGQLSVLDKAAVREVYGPAH